MSPELTGGFCTTEPPRKPHPKHFKLDTSEAQTGKAQSGDRITQLIGEKARIEKLVSPGLFQAYLTQANSCHLPSSYTF